MTDQHGEGVTLVHVDRFVAVAGTPCRRHQFREFRNGLRTQLPDDAAIAQQLVIREDHTGAEESRYHPIGLSGGSRLSDGYLPIWVRRLPDLRSACAPDRQFHLRCSARALQVGPAAPPRSPLARRCDLRPA